MSNLSLYIFSLLLNVYALRPTTQSLRAPRATNCSVKRLHEKRFALVATDISVEIKL